MGFRLACELPFVRAEVEHEKTADPRCCGDDAGADECVGRPSCRGRPSLLWRLVFPVLGTVLGLRLWLRVWVWLRLLPEFRPDQARHQGERGASVHQWFLRG